jgi:WD40 repeat protein
MLSATEFPKSPLRSACLRPGYTLAELGIAIALVAIVLGIVMEVRRLNRGADREIASMQLSSDGSRVVAGFSDGSAAEWDTNAGILVGSSAASEQWDSQYPVVISADGRMAARILLDLPRTGGFARALQVCSLETGREIMRRPITAIVPGGLVFSKDGSRLALAGTDEVFVIDPHSPTAEDISIVQRRASGPPLWRQWRVLEFDPSGHELYHLSQSAEVTKWKPEGAPTVARNASQELVAYGIVAKTPTPAKYHPRPQKPTGGNYELRMMAFSPDGKRMVTASRDTYTSAPQWIIELLDSDAFDTIKSASANIQDYPTLDPTGIEFIDDGKTLAVLFDNRLEYWDAETLKRKQAAIRLDGKEFISLLRFLSSAPGTGMLAVADQRAIHYFNGKQWRKIVDISPSQVLSYALAGALLVVAAGWLWIRVRRRRTRPVAADAA